MKKSNITFFVAVSVVVLAILSIAIYEIVAFVQKNQMEDLRREVEYDAGPDEYVPLETVPFPGESVETMVYNTDTGERERRYIDPGLLTNVDFVSLWDETTDIYAWISIPGTVISYPVLQYPGPYDVTDYYLRRDVYGNPSVAGCIYSQHFYNQDFDSDSLTVIYGHNMRNNTMFGSLDDYYNETFVNEHDRIYIYTPYRAYRYKVVAVLVRDADNIMYEYGGTSESEGDFNDFISDFNSGRVGTGWVRPGFEADSNQQFIALSTCTGVNNQRMIVVAYRDDVL